MCTALAKRGIDVTCFAGDLDELGSWLPVRKRRLSETSRAVRTAEVGFEVRYFPTRWPTRWAFSPEMATAIRQRIMEFDIVHIHQINAFSTSAAAHYSRSFHIPYILQPHGALDSYSRRRKGIRKAIYNRLIERRNVNGASAIQCTTHGELEDIKSWGIPCPAFVVPLAFSPPAPADIPPRGTFVHLHPELRGRRLISYVGRVANGKGLDLLVKAFAAVASTHRDAHLVVAGPAMEGFDRSVDKWLSLVGLSKRSTILGMLSRREMNALLLDTDIWTLPSRSESFGISVLEAMACGTPVIISDQVKIQDVVGAAGAGLVVKCDADELAQAMLYLLADQPARRRLGNAGRRLVFEHFTWEVATNRQIAVYERIIGQPPSGDLPCESETRC
jgi:glycosyltransferase involved in cell wall biosynthesis